MNSVYRYWCGRIVCLVRRHHHHMCTKDKEYRPAIVNNNDRYLCVCLCGGEIPRVSIIMFSGRMDEILGQKGFLFGSSEFFERNFGAGG